MKFAALLFLSLATFCADVNAVAFDRHHGGGGFGGGGGGGYGRCRIVPSETTSCSGVAGTSCKDSTALTVSELEPH